MDGKIASLFKSRRFWLAVAGAVAVAAHETLGIAEEDVLKITGVVIAWIVGDSLRKTE